MRGSFFSWIRVALLGAALSAAAGCSLIGSHGDTSTAATEAAGRSEDRSISVSLVGGNHLNPNQWGDARPVQVCVYVVRSSHWTVPEKSPESTCASKADHADIVAVERRILAPHQFLEFNFRSPQDGELWLVVDADYALPPADYLPLRLDACGDSRGRCRLAAWLDGNGISDASDGAIRRGGDADMERPRVAEAEPPRAKESERPHAAAAPRRGRVVAASASVPVQSAALEETDRAGDAGDRATGSEAAAAPDGRGSYIRQFWRRP